MFKNLGFRQSWFIMSTDPETLVGFGNHTVQIKQEVFEFEMENDILNSADEAKMEPDQ